MSILPDRKMAWESERRFNRRMAKKYNLDFEYKCQFWEQVSPMCSGLTCGLQDDLVKVKMQSGKTALYLVEKDTADYGGTGQRNWRFTFQKYL